MKSNELPTFEVVSGDLGKESLALMGKAVGSTRDDLANYRAAFPHWIAQHTARGLANWIHDRLWFHLASSFDEHEGIEAYDNNVTRELIASTKYRIRAKRHDEDMRTRNYPTQTALDFRVQPALSPDLEEFKLQFGYVWKSEENEIGDAVLTMYNEKELVWWAYMPNGETTWQLSHTGPATAPQAGASVPGFEIVLPNIKKKERDSK